MSYNENHKKLNIEIDDMNIKTHLNTSLDLSGISVSEDLILRTLTAIKEQTTVNNENVEQTSVKRSAKIIPMSRYVRGLATACAAVILVVAGYAAIRQIPVSMKSASDTTTQEYSLMSKEAASESDGATTSDANLKEAPTTDAASTGEAEISASDDATMFSTTAETQEAADNANGTMAKDDMADSTGANLADSSDASASENEDISISSEGIDAEEQKATSALGSPDAEVVYNTFRDIFIPSPEQAEYITITDNASKDSITITDSSEIQDFYEVMDDHEFTASGTDNTGSQNFTVEMKSLDTQMLYTMLVGNYLTVRYSQGTTVSESIYYALDKERFQGDIETFYLKYSYYK